LAPKKAAARLAKEANGGSDHRQHDETRIYNINKINEIYLIDFIDIFISI
jgi:hypothetical protein